MEKHNHESIAEHLEHLSTSETIGAVALLTAAFILGRWLIGHFGKG